MFSTLLRMGLGALAGALREAPKNDSAWTYDIIGFDNSKYITRTLLPRIAGHRVILHRFHREDFDRHLHNHPWSHARFTILSGGYVEERLVANGLPLMTEQHTFSPGMTNLICASTYHRITHVEPNTWTLGILGERSQDWGFLMDGGEHVPWRDYFARLHHAPDEGSAAS
jgi:hypothetical protein